MLTVLKTAKSHSSFSCNKASRSDYVPVDAIVLNIALYYTSVSK